MKRPARSSTGINLKFVSMKFTLSISLILFSTNLFSQSVLPIQKKLHAEVLPNSKDSIYAGTLSVYENRETNAGRKIDLNIAVIPAMKGADSSTPIFLMEGGPGVAATNPFNIYFYTDPENGYRNHDVVLVDIRGTGKSNPLNCMSLQVKDTWQDQFSEMYPPAAVKECYDELSKRADLTQYTTVNVVKDLEDVRKFLGYSKISIFGLSYGTRVCLVYMSMFPESIESCVLWSPIPTYGRIPLYHARFAQNALDKLFEQCRNDSVCHDSFPNLKNEFTELMQAGRSAPFKVRHPDQKGKMEQLSISWDAFETKVRSQMYTPAGLRSLPYLIHQSYLGNFEPFLALYSQLPDTDAFIAEGLYLCVTCSEDVPFIQDGEIDSLTRETFMGTYRIDQQRSACRNWVRGKIPDDYFTPTTSNIPTLIFSGSLDPITPPSNAEEIASHLSNCTLITIPEMSHTFDGLNHPECFDKIVVEFIDHPSKPVNSDCIRGMTAPGFKVK